MFTQEEIDELEKVARTLRGLIREKDDSPVERSIADALTHLSCAVRNAEMILEGKRPMFGIRPQIVVLHLSDQE